MVNATAEEARTTTPPAKDAAMAVALPMAIPATAAKAVFRPEANAKPTIPATPGPGMTAMTKAPAAKVDQRAVP
jgi:hypothetical protein